MDTGQQAAPQNRDTADGENAGSNKVTDDIRERMSSLRPRAAEGMEHTADAVRRAAGSLRGDEAWLAQLVEQGADKLSDLAQTLRTNDLPALLSRTEQFARQQPVLFTGAAMAIGFALTRAATATTRAAADNPSREAVSVGN